jgi:predicted nucleotide-binding protein
MSLEVALNDRPPFSGRPSLTGHCGHGWTYSVPRPVAIDPEQTPLHGHVEGAREAVARYVERLGFEPIILHEQASQGMTIIEKIEANSDVGFAVVLLTADDVGARKGEEHRLRDRARQNVVLELGYFIAKLTRSRVCALKRGDTEVPSDFGGVVYVTFDDAGGWKEMLGRELEAAGFQIDWNLVMRPSRRES